jgi:hypothetical protein
MSGLRASIYTLTPCYVDLRSRRWLSLSLSLSKHTHTHTRHPRFTWLDRVVVVLYLRAVRWSAPAAASESQWSTRPLGLAPVPRVAATVVNTHTTGGRVKCRPRNAMRRFGGQGEVVVPDGYRTVDRDGAQRCGRSRGVDPCATTWHHPC